MAKKALLDVLEQTIGKYVRNLDAESLNVAVWSGKIELNSLELDVDAVNAELDRQAAEAPNLAIPFRVVSGQFGNFTIDVPWANLMSKSVVLRASSLSISVEPYNRTESADFLSAVFESEAIRAKKVIQHRIQSIKQADDFRRRKNALRELAEQDLQSTTKTMNEQSNQSSSSFSARLIRRIIENFQIEIQGVHVTINGSEGSAGVVLKSLQLVTTDKNGKRTFVDRTQPSVEAKENLFLHKALSIIGLGVYIDDKTEGTKLPSIGETEDENDNDGIDEHSYILAPLSFDASLRQADSSMCIDFPKYLLKSELNALSVLLSRRQIELAGAIERQIRPSQNVARPIFPEYRPLERVSSRTAVDWWKYAVRCIGRLSGRRSWVEFFLAFQKRKRYITLYKRSAHSVLCTWLQPLQEDEETEIAAIELDRSISVEGIMYWRNISDAQAKKEMEKHVKQLDSKKAAKSSSIFTSLFGSTTTSAELTIENEPPITLTTEEMKELEGVDQSVESELTIDSQLYDISFILGSFRIHLSSYGKRQLAALDMGRVFASFNANANGSFTFDAGITSLTIDDKVTPNSFFPYILRNQESLFVENDQNINQNLLSASGGEALRIQMEKSKDQHQSLRIHLSTFEAIASPIFLRELKRFTSPTVSPSSQIDNAVLAQSMSGSVDLFYDASDGGFPLNDDNNCLEPIEWGHDGHAKVDSDGQAIKGDISQKMIEAWKTKKETKATWTVDCDLRAPIVFIPESCVDPKANVLAFDLGNLKFNYGKMDTNNGKVAKWFQDNPRGDGNPLDLILDTGYMGISSLSFMVGKVASWKNLTKRHDTSACSEDEEAVIEPIMLNLNFGVETRVQEDIPRVCILGVLPVISFRLSCDQLSRILTVSNVWTTFLNELAPTTNSGGESETLQDKASSQELVADLSNSEANPDIAEATGFNDVDGKEKTPQFTKFYADVRLQRLSVKVFTASKGGLDAHLISVVASTSVNSNGTSIARLCMGWFWLLDQLVHDSPRIERLIVHSSLPSVSEDSSPEKRYNFLEKLEKLGVFNEDFEGSAELADMIYKQRSVEKSFGSQDPFCFDKLDGEDYNVDVIVDAVFSSLHINWNPPAVKRVVAFLGEFASALSSKNEKGELLVAEAETTQKKRRNSETSYKTVDRKKNRASTGDTMLRARMDGLHLILNSAIDDLPLFTLSMSRTSFCMVSGDESSRRLTIHLGELKVASPEMGRTDPLYRNVLGLSSSTSESLLSVSYFSGRKAIAVVSQNDTSIKDFESVGIIELSPMRMVYIQAQVLSLVEYFTAGILGALASQAASSAVQVATEIAMPTDSKTKFCVKASRFEFILPIAAYRKEYISLQLGKLIVEYIMTVQTGGKAAISLMNVTMQNSEDFFMLDVPIGMDIDVVIPLDGIGNKDDQAMRVKVAISNSPFKISKRQYSQIMDMLSENIGELDLFLRNEKSQALFSVENHVTEPTVNSNETALVTNEVSHAGVQIIDNPRWIFMQIEMKSLSLQMCGEDEDDPIILISAVEAFVELNMYSDQGKKRTVVTLKDLFCEDQRLEALTRQHRSIVYQARDPEGHKQTSQDAFVISYSTDISEKLSTVEITIGKPRFVLIPDAIYEVLDFLSQPKPVKEADKKLQKPRLEELTEVVELSATESNLGIETAVVMKSSEPVSTMLISVKTSNCSVIFVDLGTAGPNTVNPKMSMSSGNRSVAETIVLGGIFNANLKMTARDSDSITVGMESEFHGDDIEVYTAFGHDLSSSIQILDPTNFALFYESKAESETVKHVDLRCAIISPVDITISMKNVALANAISASLSLLMENDTPEGNNDNIGMGLDSTATHRIDLLAAALENDGADDSELGIEVTPDGLEEDNIKTEEAAHAPTVTSQSSYKLTTSDIRVTIVNDLQGLDEALLRLSTRNFITSAQVLEGARIKPFLPCFTAFDFTVHTSFLADYFDASTNSWKVLLVKPWELSLRGRRGPSERLPSNLPYTTFDVESLSCHVSFSEQFLMSLASANRMWAIYTAASTSSMSIVDQSSAISKGMRKSIAASAARSFVAALPYAVENRTGSDIEILINGVREEKRLCSEGSIEYFRFEPPVGSHGTGGKRLYGQDVNFEKSVVLFITNSEIKLPHLDSLLGKAKTSHKLENGLIVTTEVVKDGKTITIHVSSGIEIINRTSIPFHISIFQNGMAVEVGWCGPYRMQSNKSANLYKSTNSLEIPLELTRQFRQEWDEIDQAKLALVFKPNVPLLIGGVELNGGTKLNINKKSFANRMNEPLMTRFDVTCRPLPSRTNPSSSESHNTVDSFVFQASVSMTIIDAAHVSMQIHLEPRSVVKNNMPIGIQIKSPMPHIYTPTRQKYANDIVDASVHDLEPESYLEVFTPGPSIAILVRISDFPVAGSSTDSMENGFVDLPLVADFRLHDSLRCIFPFVSRVNDMSVGTGGSEFFIVDGSKGLSDLDDNAANKLPEDTVMVKHQEDFDGWRTFCITVRNYAIDHTGSILFEQIEHDNQKPARRNSGISRTSQRSSMSYQKTPPIGAYAARKFSGRISLLPGLNTPIRLLHLTMEGDSGLRTTSHFQIEDISICDGGVEATPLTWENGRSSGYFAYRKLVNLYQSVVHIIPEYIVYNGSKRHPIRVHCLGGPEISIGPGKFGSVRPEDQETALLSVKYDDLDAATPLIRIDSLGLRVAVVKLNDGTPIARVAIQTVVGGRDSRLVVKLGDVETGPLMSSTESNGLRTYGMMENDCFRMRLRWSELIVTLNEARPIGAKQAIIESALDKMNHVMSPSQHSDTDTGTSDQTWVKARQKLKTATSFEGAPKAVCTLRFHRFTVDWQRVYKEEVDNHWSTRILQSPERSQISVVIHHVQILDENPTSPLPIVFDSTSEYSFFDLCIRMRGSTSENLVQVDLIDLNLAHRDGVSQKIYISTSEDFVWKLLDVSNRILEAAAEFAGVDIALTWDNDNECFNVSIKDQDSTEQESETKYTPPKSDVLYHIKKTKVSPFTLVVSFRRNPQVTRYTMFKDVQFATIMNYFTRQLKFKIEKAELSFSRYEANNVKGPLDRVIELLSTVYMSRVKTKLVTIMTAASFQDWKYLASRDGGDDEFMEGDILRVTGNLAGKTAGYVLRHAGKGLGGGVSTAASAVGQGIENASAKIGARAIGAGVNSVVSGVGEGVGHAVSGVGTGAGKLLQGAGMGVGHVFGGISGGATIMGKGIGKAITTGDGRAAASGIVRGATVFGTGVGQGVESVVTGTVEGTFTAGQGLFSGVKGVGKGIGNALLACWACSCCFGNEDEGISHNDSLLTDPLISEEQTSQHDPFLLIDPLILS